MKEEMKNIEEAIALCLERGMKELYGAEVQVDCNQIQHTKRDFEGDLSFVVFPYLRYSRKGPEETAEELGGYLKGNMEEVKGFGVVKGFVNLQVSDDYWRGFLGEHIDDVCYGERSMEENGERIVIEYSSPNTNKPLHLGHIRNNLLGFSVAEILKANGYDVIRVNLVNDRGVHICKSMLAWQKWGDEETPASSGEKGDHLVGKYYVLFDKEYKKEIATMISEGVDKELAEK